MMTQGIKVYLMGGRFRSLGAFLKTNFKTGLAVFWIILVSGAAIIGPFFPEINPYQMNFLSSLEPPSTSHLMGTDSNGRDILARVIYGASVSLTVGLGSVAVGLILGGVLGVYAAFYSGVVDRLTMGMMNVMLAFPSLILAIAIVAYLGASMLNVIVAIGLLFIPAFARITRANTLSLKGREYVQFAKTLGASDTRIIFREIFPNLIGGLLAYSLVMFAVAVIAEASLGFLGLSVPAPMPSWGGLIASERGNMDMAPHVVLGPGIVLFLTVVALNTLGDKVQKAFDIRESDL